MQGHLTDDTGTLPGVDERGTPNYVEFLTPTKGRGIDTLWKERVSSGLVLPRRYVYLGACLATTRPVKPSSTRRLNESGCGDSRERVPKPLEWMDQKRGYQVLKMVR